MGTVTEHAKIDLDVKAIMSHADWPSNNGGAYKDCSTITNACKWDTNMYPTLWDTDCTHYLDIPLESTLALKLLHLLHTVYLMVTKSNTKLVAELPSVA